MQPLATTPPLCCLRRRWSAEPAAAGLVPAATLRRGPGGAAHRAPARHPGHQHPRVGRCLRRLLRPAPGDELLEVAHEISIAAPCCSRRADEAFIQRGASIAGFDVTIYASALQPHSIRSILQFGRVSPHVRCIIHGCKLRCGLEMRSDEGLCGMHVVLFSG